MKSIERNKKEDHLLTPENCLFTIIDFQPLQVSSIKSRDPEELKRNIVKLSRGMKLFNVPTVISTVRANNDPDKLTIPEIMDIFKGNEQIDRTTINSWEDQEYYDAIVKTGRKKIVMAGLWTEACCTFPSLDAIKEGYEVYLVADSIAGTSKEAHEYALRRLEQAGVKMVSWVQVLCELQRDWAREETAKEFSDILFK